MEKLFDINIKKDNLFAIGISLLNQLKFLHKFGVHSDIKPMNVMKNGKNEYFLIDYGGTATQKLGHGYKRHTWNSQFTSQVPFYNDQIATHKNDLLELGYTMNFWAFGPKNKDVKTKFKGKIGKYMEKVNKISENEIGEADYQDLVNILAAEN